MLNFILNYKTITIEFLYLQIFIYFAKCICIYFFYQNKKHLAFYKINIQLLHLHLCTKYLVCNISKVLRTVSFIYYLNLSEFLKFEKYYVVRMFMFILKNTFSWVIIFSVFVYSPIDLKTVIIGFIWFKFLFMLLEMLVI